MIVPLILIAECFSWYAVLTTNYLGNAIENSIWAVAFFIVAVGLCRLLPEFDGVVRAVLIRRNRRDRRLSRLSRDRRRSDVSERGGGTRSQTAASYSSLSKACATSNRVGS